VKLELLDDANFVEPLSFRLYIKKEPYGFDWVNESSIEWPTVAEWQDDLMLSIDNAIFYEIADAFALSSDKWDEYGVTDFCGDELSALQKNISLKIDKIKAMPDDEFLKKFEYLIDDLESEDSKMDFDATKDLPRLIDELVHLLSIVNESVQKAIEKNGCIVVVGI